MDYIARYHREEYRTTEFPGGYEHYSEILRAVADLFEEHQAEIIEKYSGQIDGFDLWAFKVTVVPITEDKVVGEIEFRHDY